MTLRFNPVYADLPTTVFEVMSRLARETGAYNLGQGFPDDPGPADVRAKAADAVVNGWNQYPPMMGIPELRQSVAAHYARFQGLTLDPDSEIMVTSGATEALAGALMALIEPGDDVVLFQPMYDAYLPLVKRAGGVPRFITLKPPHWTFTDDDLSAAITQKTKVVLLNNPLNPSGTVYSRDDLDRLGQACAKVGAVVLADEVWEHVIFDGRQHVSVLNVPSMAGRAIKVGSAGKIFCLTGWKVGFVCADASIIKVLAKAHQFLTFTTPPNLQAAVAYGLGKDEAHFAQMRTDLQRARDLFAAGLADAGFDVLPAHGTYFINVDLSGRGIADDVAFCETLVREHGVAAIPVSAFYAQTPVTSVVRFCFAKKDETLKGSLARLAGVFRDAPVLGIGLSDNLPE
jgi:N-succinyldiaminopimelate aminotransferase